MSIRGVPPKVEREPTQGRFLRGVVEHSRKECPQKCFIAYENSPLIRDFISSRMLANEHYSKGLIVFLFPDPVESKMSDNKRLEVFSQLLELIRASQKQLQWVK